ncbi:MAG: YqaJ viral recombinase family protein [Thiomonas sp.]
MKHHKLQQGSPEWHALRARHFTASEAPVMMGASPYMSRAELLRRKATGIAPEEDAKAALFAQGHASEDAMRPVVERSINDELFPDTVTAEVEGLPLLASLDGITMDGFMIWEHKMRNQETMRCVRETGLPPEHHIWQIEHQLLITGAKRALFTCGDPDDNVSCTVSSDPARRAALIAGWRQFAADLAAYQPQPAAEPQPVGAAPETLPALRIAVEGRVVDSNLEAWRAHALAVIGSINRNLQTDQDFADAERTVKWASDAEDKLKAAKDAALAQAADIERLFRTVDDVVEELRRTRLSLDRQIKARKEAIRAELVQQAVSQVRAHYASIAAELGEYAPLAPATLAADMGAQIKGLKSLQSMSDKLDSAVAREKIDADMLARRVRENRAIIEAAIAEHGINLWPDAPQLCALLTPESVRGYVASRVADHAKAQVERLAAEQAREAAERQRMAEQPSRSASQHTGQLVKLGDINAAIAPLSITADGLEKLGFIAGKSGTAKVYRASDFPLIVRRLIAILERADLPEMEAA